MAHALSIKFSRALLFLAMASLCAGHSTIFVSRHADRFGTEPDPSLTPLGMKQAEALARLLVSANIRYIDTTELLRTRQTAAPTARACVCGAFGHERLLSHSFPRLLPLKHLDVIELAPLRITSLHEVRHGLAILGNNQSA